MPSFATRRRVPFSARQMFDLVADVERYPEFLPLCEGLVVRERRPLGDGELLIADMSIGYKAIRETFRTRVELLPRQSRIAVSYVDGPFRELDNRWTFMPTATGSEVDFQIRYEFKSVMLAMLVGALFDKAFRRYAEAFEARARAVYGRPAASDRDAVAPSRADV